jgi:hypothetical protein
VLLIAAVLAGAAAAVTTVGDRSHRYARGHARAVGARDLGVAAVYLGFSRAALAGALQAGQSLVDVANAAGKSPSGLIAALVTEKRARPKGVSKSLEARVNAEVNRMSSRPAHVPQLRARISPALLSAPTRLDLQAAAYLGVSPARLQLELGAGQTLGQVANATSGKSAAGLVAAIVLARRERLAYAVATHRLTAGRASLINARLLARVTASVDRRPAAP